MTTSPRLPTLSEPVDQTSARDAGHTTSEHFWTKVLVICGIVVSVGGFVGDAIASASGLIPGGSSIMRWAGVIGAAVALIKSIAYEVSRTLVKMKLVDAEIAASKVPPEKQPTADQAAATVLGEDRPEIGS